jgi:hypothetical protein
MSDASGPVQTDSPAAPQAAEYPPDYPFAPQYQTPRPPEHLALHGVEIPPIPHEAPSHNQFLFPWFAAGLGGSCCFNFLVGTMVGPSEPILLMAALFAAVLAQLALQSTWIVWSPRPLWQRQLVGVIAGWMLLGAFLVGLPELVRAFLCSVPLVMVSAQIPLWALRTYLGWRILSVDEPVSIDRPLTIGDMIAATVVVAIAFGFIRLASDDAEFYAIAWIGWLIAVPSIGAASLASLPPLLFLVLRDRAWPLGGFFAWCGYATLILTVCAIVISILSRRPDPEGIMLLYLAPLGAGTLTWLALWGLRACGYRLVIGNPEATRA